MNKNNNNTVEIAVSPKDLYNDSLIISKLENKLKTKVSEYHVLRRSIDARGKDPLFRLRVSPNQDAAYPSFKNTINLSCQSKKVIVVGAGPAGYFAALQLIRQGITPIIIERGKDVRERRRDLKAIQQEGIVNPDSNYCFGEGGAGTYSDGKLYTRSHKKGNIKDILHLLVEHGAKEDILIDAHPHIGSNKLPQIIANIRQTIESFGGQVLFNTRVTDFIIKGTKILGIRTQNDDEIMADYTILATGHSARDIFKLCQKHNILTLYKPFALGVRIEHPQALIDEIQYNQRKREDNLPAASYSLVCQVEKRGVYSFCMCPGGLIVPASTAPGEIVVNGMSLSRRDSKFANSGTVVSIEDEDIAAFAGHGSFKGLAFQQEVEQNVFSHSDGSQKAPAQRLTDFVMGKNSNSLNESSYIPGLISKPVHKILPNFISQRLRDGIKQFSKKMKGYYTEEANVVATESRTSCPITIPRDKISYQHPQISNLFPCGEGAGYAGGIISAALDGQNVANAVAKSILNT